MKVFGLLLIFHPVKVHARICSGKVENRFDCAPDQDINQESCLERSCCWLPLEENSDLPWCFYQETYGKYKVTSTISDFDVIATPLSETSWPNKIENMRVSIQKCTVSGSDSSIYRLRMKDNDRKRYEHTEQPNIKCYDLNDINICGDERPSSPCWEKISNELFLRLQVGDDGSSDVTVNGPITFTDQFIEMNLVYTSHLYHDKTGHFNFLGFGERRGDLILGSNHWKHGVWNRDLPPTLGTNLYGDQPIWIAHHPFNNQAIGTIWWNSNAKSFELLPLADGPDGNGKTRLTLRSNGGIIDLFFVIDKTPDLIVNTMNDIVGKPTPMPAWSLGYQLCRWGYYSDQRTFEVTDELRNANIPQEVQWNDIDYMDRRRDFTFDPKSFHYLPWKIAELHKKGQKYVAILDPAIPSGVGNDTYEPLIDGLAKNVFISENKVPVNGSVWPGSTYFPDFTHPNTTEYWADQIERLYNLGVKFDGLWIDMNEPANFVSGTADNTCPENKYNYPPWIPKIADNQLFHRTLCPHVSQFLDRHYNIHNLYGLHESKATHYALLRLKPKKRPFILSRSTSLTSSRYAAHWTGDNFSKWEDIKYSISAMISFNIFGIKMVGVDVCGFNGDTEENLCVRWHQIGALLYSMYRNHNTHSTRPQHPTAFSKKSVDLIREGINRRYSLLPYLYTVLLRPGMYVRPMGFEDQNLINIDTQFMIGKSLLVCPNLNETDSLVTCAFPTGTWCSLISDLCLDMSKTGQVQLSIRESGLDYFQKSETIIFSTRPEMTVEQTMSNPIELNAVEKDGKASGELWIDDGESINSTAAEDESVRGALTDGVLVTFELNSNSLLIKCHQVGEFWNITDKITEIKFLKIRNRNPQMIKSLKLNSSIYKKPKLTFSTSFLLPINIQINKFNCNQNSSVHLQWD